MENDITNNLNTEILPLETKKSSKRIKSVLTGVLAIVLVASAAFGAFYVTRNLNQAAVPTAPKSNPFAAVKNADQCIGSNGKSRCNAKTEYCDGAGRCRPNGGNADPNPTPTTYVCTATNCPAPRFYCHSNGGCIDTLSGSTPTAPVVSAGKGNTNCDSNTRGYEKGISKCCVPSGVGGVDVVHWSTCASGYVCSQGVGCLPGAATARPTSKATDRPTATATIRVTTTVTATITATATQPPVCVDTTWTPNPNTVCTDITLTQTSNCGKTREIDGTKDCTVACVDTTWTPNPNTICDDKTLTQVSNCGKTRDIDGTKVCTVACVDTTWTPATNTVCKGSTFTQTSNCDKERDVDGSKICNTLTPTPAGCNKSCDNDEGCLAGLSCDTDSGTCRRPSCSEESSCKCPVVVAEETSTPTQRIVYATKIKTEVLPETGILDFPGIATFGGGLLIAIIGILLAL